MCIGVERKTGIRSPGDQMGHCAPTGLDASWEGGSYKHDGPPGLDLGCAQVPMAVTASALFGGFSMARFIVGRMEQIPGIIRHVESL